MDCFVDLSCNDITGPSGGIHGVSVGLTSYLSKSCAALLVTPIAASACSSRSEAAQHLSEEKEASSKNNSQAIVAVRQGRSNAWDSYPPAGEMVKAIQVIGEKQYRGIHSH